MYHLLPGQVICALRLESQGFKVPRAVKGIETISYLMQSRHSLLVIPVFNCKLFTLVSVLAIIDLLVHIESRKFTSLMFVKFFDFGYEIHRFE